MGLPHRTIHVTQTVRAAANWYLPPVSSTEQPKRPNTMNEASNSSAHPKLIPIFSQDCLILAPTGVFYTNGNELIISDIVIVQREREQASLFGELFHISKPIELSSDDEVAETTVQEIRYHKMDNSQSIVGAWTMDKDSIKSPVFLFFPDNRYMLVDPVGSATQSTPAACAKPGVELATYAFDAASGTLKLSSFTYNTAGCAGLSEYSGKPITFKIDTGAQNATLSGERLAPITLQRLSN